MKQRRHVVIIGGGISGVAAALRLQHRSPEVEITVIERERRLGGKIVTARTLGYTIEGGPDSFLASKPAALRLCQELHIDDELQATRADRRGTFVMRAGALIPIPEGLSGLVPARLEPLLASDLLTPEGKERVSQEPQIASRYGDDDESLAAFMERRFGRELYDRLLEALMSGIYAGSGDDLSLLATFPHLRTLEQEHGSVLRALSQAGPAAPSTARSGFLAPVHGMQAIIEAAIRALTHVQIVRRQAASMLTQTGSGWRVDLEHGAVIEADGVVVATPSSVTARLLASIDLDIADVFARIPLVSTATVALGYAEAHVPNPLHGYGYLIPRAENQPVTACTWVSSKWAHRAPPGRVLLRVFLGRAGFQQPAQGPNEQMVGLAREELRRTLGVTAEPEIISVTRWPDAMPQYTVGHVERLAAARARLQALQGLAIAGNALSGVGIPDCIRSGWDAADSVLEP